MALETPINTIYSLVATNPTASDPVSQADDHIRNIKTALLASFAGSDAANGYQTLGKIIIQWGSATTVSGTKAVTYPIPFPTGTLATFACLSTTVVNAAFFANVDNGTTTGLNVLACNTSGVGVNVTVKWLAIGH